MRVKIICPFSKGCPCPIYITTTVSGSDESHGYSAATDELYEYVFHVGA